MTLAEIPESAATNATLRNNDFLRCYYVFDSCTLRLLNLLSEGTAQTH